MDPDELASLHPRADDGSRSRADAEARFAALVNQTRKVQRALADTAERVAEVEEQVAVIHDAMAGGGAPVPDARRHAQRARRVAAAERATAKAYRGGEVPSAAVRKAIRDARGS